MVQIQIANEHKCALNKEPLFSLGIQGAWSYHTEYLMNLFHFTGMSRHHVVSNYVT